MARFRPLALLALLICSSAGAKPLWFEAQDGHGEWFHLEQLRGQVVAVTFASRYTKEEASRVNDALASRDVRVISVIDFAGIPSMFHRYAKRKVAEHDQPDRIRHLVDEQGAFRQQFGTDPERRVDILVIDRDGTLRGRYYGEKQLPDALRLVDELSTSSASL